jgi:hypothetical protein
MNSLERWREYIDIGQLQELGLNKTQIANRLDISRTTLYKYLSMTAPEFQQWNEDMRTRSKTDPPDPPMGQQTQVDFGEMKLVDGHKQWKTMRFIAFVLSHSRYKYVEWLVRPFTTKDVIASHERAFTYLGGMTKELVYD